jgi:lipid-A-disaccharide synthase
VRTVHYVSPSVWAWREGRAAKIGRSADLVLCLFPMEPPIYARHGVDARFVGHPLADAMPLEPDRDAAKRRLGVADDRPVLAVLPGSRLGEIERLWPVFLEAARRVAARVPGVRILVPAASPACRAAIEQELARAPLAGVRVLDGDAHAAMTAADVVLLASGTATLEAMLAKRPMVVGYRISALTYRLVMGLGLMKVNRYSLPNVLANEPIVPELMQHDCTPENLADAVLAWFADDEARATLLPRYHAIHARLRGDASAGAATAIAGLLEASP